MNYLPLILSFIILALCGRCHSEQDLKFILSAIIPENFKKGIIKVEYEFGESLDRSAASDGTNNAAICKGRFDTNLTQTTPVDPLLNYSDCSEVPSSKGSGVYKLIVDGNALSVYCSIDSKSDNKYSVIQRRLNGKEDFYRGWNDYENGFGDPKDEFWIGNRVLNLITSRASYKLRIDMEAFDSTKVYAEYDSFSVGPPESKYTLSVSGFSGTSGDSFSYHNGQKFTTKDQDNDAYSENCAQMYKGGWWYSACHESNLNGFYFNGSHQSYADGVNWNAFRGHYESMKVVEMKIIKNSPPIFSLEPGAS